MKILFSILGAGNGHVSRAREIVPRLLEHGEVDIALSGTDAQVELSLVPKYRCHGLIFFLGRHGGLDYWRTLRGLRPGRLFRDIRSFPITQYDVVINDFEPITARSAARHNVPTVSLSHQASFLSERVPRPRGRDYLAELVFRRYAPCRRSVGLHFERYDSFIHTPVIRSEVREVAPVNKGHYTVYLPAYGDGWLSSVLSEIKAAKWQVFSKTAKRETSSGNVTFRPIENSAYLESLAGCAGLLTGGGFEGPAEALFLGKKLFIVPQKGQYEQRCNAEALARLGVAVAHSVDAGAIPALTRWVEDGEPKLLHFPDNAAEVVEEALYGPPLAACSPEEAARKIGGIC